MEINYEDFRKVQIHVGTVISVKNNELGKPSIILKGNALKRLNHLSNKDCSIVVSLSDEKDYAIANVIIFENKDD